MKPFKFSSGFKVILASTVLAVASASATPIYVASEASSSFAASDNVMFSNRMLNQRTVYFRGEDSSAMIGHYATGPWRKTEFLRAGRGSEGGGGNNVVVPVVETVTGLPEPSTSALLGIGLVALMVLRRRRTNR